MVKCYPIRNELLREVLSELLGTFIFGSFVYGAATQNNLGGYFNLLQQNIGVGLGLMASIYVSGDVSGAQFNPALTFVFCLEKRTAWKKLPWYCLVQTIAAFAAAAAQFGLSSDILQHFNGGVKNATSAAIFIAYPSPIAGDLPVIFNQILATFCFICGCLAMTEKNNSLTTPTAAPFAIGLLVTAVGCSFGLNGGPAINPAIDLGPRILLTLVGWGTEPFRNYNWFWVPLIGPLLGGSLAWALYSACISRHRPTDDEEYLEPVTKTSDTADLKVMTKL